MHYRQAKVNKQGKLFKLMKPGIVDLLLNGRVLIIDPSIGSGSSMPGYCIVEGGVPVESGILQIPPSASTHNRLYYLSQTIREDLPGPWDVLIVEEVPMARFQKGFANMKAQVPLHRAVGAVHASVLCREFIPVTPQTWHTVAPEGYEKTDEGDCLCMWEVTRQYALAAVNQTPSKRRRKKLQK